MIYSRDIEAMLTDERHLGFGLATIRLLPEHLRTSTIQAVVRQANSWGLDYEQTFHWTNSKYARWLVDDVGSGKLPSRVVKHQMTLAKVREVQQ